jgi:hypothetical protein
MEEQWIRKTPMKEQKEAVLSSISSSHQSPVPSLHSYRGMT